MSRPIEIRGLVKRFGDVTAVDHVDLTVEPGDVYGYLGPNGAGKTTTLRIVLGLVRPDEGEVTLFGDQRSGPHKLDGVAGFVEDPTFYPYLSGRKNLELLGALDGGVDKRLVSEPLDTVGLLARADDRVGTYSQGMRQRLGVAAALLREPRLLILDEPANGLDPRGIRDLRALVRNLSEQGVTIMYSSHLLAEVEEVCSRVAILDRGRLIYEGGLDELRGASAETYRLRCADPERASVLLREHGAAATVTADAAVEIAATPETIERATVELGRAGIGIRSLVPERASLEELFFRLTETGPPAEPELEPAAAR